MTATDTSPGKPANTRIADLIPAERPRERLIDVGAGALADRELLAVLLGTGGSNGVRAHALAERVLAHFGGVDRLAKAHPRELSSIAGIDTAKAAGIVAAFELARRANRGSEPTRISTTADIARLVAPMLSGCTRERLVVVSCDRSNRVLGCDIVTDGAADRTLVPVREVLVTALRRDAQAFALAHNHPSGSPEPSIDDISATARLAEGARDVELRLLDHLIIAGTNWTRVSLS